MRRRVSSGLSTLEGPFAFPPPNDAGRTLRGPLLSRAALTAAASRPYSGRVAGFCGPTASKGSGAVVRVQVASLAMDQTTHNPVVLLEAPDEKEAGVLPIWIGSPEATAIASQLYGQTFERPLTHDLLRIVIEGLDARVNKVLITELRGNTFFAKIYIARGEDIFVIDARPSDSIALALRTRAPIYVEPELFRRNSRPLNLGKPEADPDPDDDPLKKYLDDPDAPGGFNL